MVTSTESGSGTADSIIQEAKDSANREINAATTEEQKQVLADKLKNELKDTDKQAKQAAKDIKKTEAEKQELKKKQALSLVRLLEAAQHEDIPIAKNKPKAQKVLEELSKRLEKQSLSNSTLAAIEEGLKDYLTGDKDITVSKPGETKTQFERDFDVMKQSDKRAAEFVGKALIDQKSQFDLEESDMKQKFGDESEQATPSPELPSSPDQEFPDSMDANGRRKYFGPDAVDKIMANIKVEDADKLHDYMITYDSAYGQAFEAYYGPKLASAPHRNLMAALYNPQAFIKYVEAEKLKIAKSGISDEEVRKKVSEKIREDVSDIVDRFFIQLARERATKPFEEIVREDFYHGIGITLTTFKTALANLSSRLETIEKERANKKFPPLLELFKDTEQTVESEEVELGEGKDRVVKPRLRIKPIPKPEPVSLSEFVKNNIELLVSEKSHIREYLHDGRSIYYHPSGKDGFYAGLGGYAERMQTTDIDTLFSLPDGQIIKDAYQLYSKFLFEQFAKQDWKHEPNQFITELESRYTAMESEVIQMLKKMYSDVPPDRLENAVYMGVGISRAIFLNEPEMAAYADPVLDEKGGGVGASYYTNDTAALNALNPMHWIMRWQGEQQIYPFLFAPIDGVHDLMKHGWDHNKILDLGKSYFDSYTKGRKNLSGKTLFIDELINMGRTGGPGTRRGWRHYFANEGHLVFKKTTEGIQTTNIDALKTWKALENIGYEVVYDMVINGRIPGELLSAKNSQWAKERSDFFSYLFTKYFDQPAEELAGYLEKIRTGGARDAALKRIRDHEVAPGSVNEEIEKEVSGIFLHRVLARVLVQRLPTRIIQDDRDRFSDTGSSRYKQLRLKLGLDIDQFDKMMKNLGLAEQMLRRNVSKEIKDLLTLQGATDLQNIDMSKIKYVLDDATLRTLLAKANLSQPEIDQAAKLLEMIRTQFANEESLNTYAAERKKNPFPFSLAIDEIDWSLMAFRGSGARMIARAVGDINLFEKNLWLGCIRQLKDTLQEIATNGKKDFSPLIEMLQKVKEAYGEVHGHNPQSYANIHRLAAGMIAYFKKDTMAKGLLNILRPWRLGKPSSIAAEMAGGRSAAVWEWDAVDVDNFIVALETKRLLPRDRYDPSKPRVYEPIWFNFAGRMIKLPEKLTLPFKIFGKNEFNLFRRRAPDYKIAYSNKLRKEHGAKWYNLVFDFAAKYGPLFMAFILWKLLKDALDEAQGKKKK